VFRTVLETMRTLFVWLVDLLLFYTPLGLGKLGESWSAYSFIQAAGYRHRWPWHLIYACSISVYAYGRLEQYLRVTLARNDEPVDLNEQCPCCPPRLFVAGMMKC
jgi:hypothetical protein